MNGNESEKSFGELPTLGNEETVNPKRPAPERSSWTVLGLSEAGTLKSPAGGIVDDGRTDGARRWRPGETILDRYVVEKELGQGGMGVVYGCLDKVGGVRVAVKCLPPELSHNTVEMEEVRENFRLVYGLSHPNIAGVRQLERDERGEYFLVMEVAEGASLRRWLRGKWKAGGVVVEEAVPILRQVAAALDYAHEKKIVHRDVKPGNVMIDGKGEVKMLDFGLASQIRTSLSRASRTYRGTSGTGPYMAPEQWRGRQQDGKTDQYALGVMAYEMLAGHLPFENSDISVLKDAVLHDEPDPIPGLPSRAMAALRRAMAKRAADRFATCGKFVEALAGCGESNAAMHTRRTWFVALLLVAVVAGGGIWTATLWQENAAARRQEAARLAADEAERQKEAARLVEEEAARRKEEAEKARLEQEAEARAKQETEAAQAAREDALKSRNRADRLASLAVETLKVRGEMDVITVKGILGENHPEVQRLKNRLQELSVQMQWWQDGVKDGSGGATGEGWIVLAEKSEKACRDDDAKVQAILNEGVLGPAHPDMIDAIAANANLKTLRDVLADGLETYREGTVDMEVAERLFRDGGFSQAEKQFKMAQGNFKKAMNILLSRMKSKANNHQEGDAGIQAWYRKLAEKGNAFAQNNLGAMYESGGSGTLNDAVAVEWYRKAAGQGLAVAQFHLGAMYQLGRGVVQSDTEAVKWYRKAADQGNASGQLSLGWMYEMGRGVVQNYAEALKWYRKSAEQGNAIARDNIGLLYRDGLGVVRNDTEAVKWFRLSAEQGNADGQVHLGLMFENGRGVIQSDTEAVKWYRKAAEQGNAWGQNNLGTMYTKGRGVVQNSAEALKWYRKSAEQGNALSQDNIGILYRDGVGVARNDTEALKWFRLSADQGNASGQLNLGWMYAMGRGVVQNYAEALKWYRKSAAQRNAIAQDNIGLLYRDGLGVARNDTEAVKWFRLSADQGNASGQLDLGWMYEMGRGVVQNHVEAVKWYRKSADQGNAIAQCNLGFMYENGRGVQRNIQEAVKWYQKSAAQGNERAQKALRSLGR